MQKNEQKNEKIFKKNEKNVIGFTFFENYLASCENLSRRQQDQMIVSIVRYVLRNEQPTFKNKYMETMFNYMKFSLNKSVSRSKARRNADVPVSEKNQNEIKLESNGNQIENKLESNNNQNIIKQQSNDNQNKIKSESNENQNENNKKEKLEIEKEKESKEKENNSLCVFYNDKPTRLTVDQLTLEDIARIASSHRTTPRFVSECLENLKNYLKRANSSYKDYYAALEHFVQTDRNYRANIVETPLPPPDLPPKKPASEAEIQAMRAAMPEFLRARFSVSDKINQKGSI